ncbi:MAG: hypothetical protein IKX22_06895 [Prevotella sp.]|nr:hypothetical protein [Prevotella sp.]
MKIALYISLFVLITTASCSQKAEKAGESEEPKEKTEVKAQPKEVDQKAILSGLIDGRYGIEMSIECKGQMVSGTYYYHSQGPNSPLKLNGVLNDDGHLELHEVNNQGQPTGHFDGRYGFGHGYKGVFVNFRGQQMSFEIVVKDVEDVTGDGQGRGFLYDYEDNDGYEGPPYSGVPNSPQSMPPSSGYEQVNEPVTSQGASRGSSSNIDAMLDAYERYINMSASLARRIHNGDHAAIIENARLAEQAEDLANRLDACKGDMSQAQLTRLNNLLVRSLQAIQP